MILRFYTYVIPSFKIDGIRSSQSPNQLHPVLVTIFLVLYAKNEVSAKIVRVYMPIFVGNPREHFHIKVKGCSSEINNLLFKPLREANVGVAQA